MAVRYPSYALRKQTAKRRNAELKKAPAPDRVLESPLVYADNLLPDVPGRVHGIVGWDPCLIQCDRCGVIEGEAGKPAWLTIMTTSIGFYRPDPRRLCDVCAEARWVA